MRKNNMTRQYNRLMTWQARLFALLALPLVLLAVAAPAQAGEDLAAARLRAELASPDPGALALPVELARAMRQFYADRAYQPVWLNSPHWSDKATQALQYLAAADREGLSARDYMLAPDMTAPHGDKLGAIADMRLTAALMRYVVDVSSGRGAPEKFDPDLFIHPRRPDPAMLLATGLAAPDFRGWLDSLPPAHAPYRRSRDGLARLRQMPADGDWPQLADGPALRAGDRDPRIAILRAQLTQWGDLAVPVATAEAVAAQASADPQFFDSALAEAVTGFQRRHGLAADGIVGAQTRRALNVPPSERARQLALNMERWRWLAPQLGPRHVRVNIADFNLVAVSPDGDTLHSPVIVGRDYRRTPVFSDRIVGLVLSPSWTPPVTILRKDLLPKLREDPDYLIRKRFRVFEGWGDAAREVDPASVDWRNVSTRNLRYWLRQAPGPDNALGGVRFTLTNDFGIYLHDTPDRGLFSRNKRDFSSGCVRVQEAEQLALFALHGDPRWPLDKLRAAMVSGETRTVKLLEPLPVHILYLTAWIDSAGRFQFRDDIYGRDMLLNQALALPGPDLSGNL
ncbi:MAG TPA: peptidoglycan-binding protein [Alphaproteobacteria bacterium]|nr:peptidoglycan-binding protein [Alphaproteobacteria bacterium]